LTFGPMDMADLKRRVLGSDGVWPTGTMGGSYDYRPDVVTAYVKDLVKDGPIKRPLKVVASCGNGTPGMFAADVLRRLGCTVIEQNCNLDYTFPHHNPNPEEHDMVQAMATAVRTHGADLALGFDGDGDRCGVVDHQGNGVLGDVLGVLLARDLVATYGAMPVIADIKSTGLYAIDPVLTGAGVRVDYWRTGHAYMKRRLHDAGSGAAFEKSGHYFYGAPVGRGYDDGLFSAVQVLRMLDRNPDRSIVDMVTTLPTTHLSPSLYRACPDDKKYALADRLTTMIQDMQTQGQTILGQKITDVLTINGVRFMIEDGTWGLVRASSNKPEIGLVFESPVSRAQMVAMFNFVDALLTANFPEVGAYNEQMKLAA
jgi:phosphomannomutase/phosphoglucomutase